MLPRTLPSRSYSFWERNTTLRHRGSREKAKEPAPALVIPLSLKQAERHWAQQSIQTAFRDKNKAERVNNEIGEENNPVLHMSVKELPF